MAHIKKPKHLILLLGTAPLLLTGCEHPLIMGQAAYMAGKFVNGEDVNIVERSYAAADYLAQQMRSFVSRDDLIKAVPLYGAKNIRDESAELSTLVPEQVGTRLTQLGYKVNLEQVSDAPKAGVINSAEKARFILSGSFQQRAKNFHIYNDVDVTISITDTKNGRIIATFDYLLPRNREITNLSKTPSVPEENIGKKPEETNNNAKSPMEIH